MSGCDRFEDLLARHIHGQLFLQEREDLECHLAMCADCERRYRETADVDRVLRQMPGKLVDPPAYLRGKIFAGLQEQKDERFPAWSRWGRWTAAAGAAAACLLAAAVFFRGTVPKEPPVTPPPSLALPAAPAPQAGVPERTVKAPPVRREVIREVKIFFYHPGASKVAVIGDFNGWDPEGVLMVASGKPGLWKTTLMLKPGAYSYNFMVDGNILVPDPSAPEQMPDGYGGTNSILLVKGGNPV